MSPAPAASTFDPLQPVEDGERVHPLRASARRPRSSCTQGVAGVDRAPLHAADGDPAPVGVVVEGGDQHLERRRPGRRPAAGPRARSSRTAAAGQARAWPIGLGAGAPLAGDGVEHREVELIGVGGQLQEEILQVSSSTSSRRDAGRSTLLTTTIGRRPRSSALRSTMRVCGIGPFDGVDQQQAAVGHVQHALDLAAEVGVAGGVDDVDLDARVGDGGVLGEDGDAPLALQIVGVQDQLARGRGVAEDVRSA